jgi:hypothetical protein
MTQERTVERLREVWDTAGVLHGISMLDSLNRESKHSLSPSDVKITSGGMTSQFQVFDVAVKPFQQ